MALLYSDENFPRGVVEHLRVLGHDVLTAQDAGNAGRGVLDEEVLAFAISQSRAVITHNRKHFFRLHAITLGQHLGIIACTVDRDEARQAQRIHEAIARLDETLAGQVVRVYRPAS